MRAVAAEFATGGQYRQAPDSGQFLMRGAHPGTHAKVGYDRESSYWLVIVVVIGCL